jgi:Arsenite efflux pump ACR3 and related permeases
MTAQCEIAAKETQGASLGFFERYLTLWVALCIVTGIVWGQLAPGVFKTLGRMEIALAAAPCTAMVFVWSNLTDGEPNFTLTHVALNDTITWAIRPRRLESAARTCGSASVGWIFKCQGARSGKALRTKKPKLTFAGGWQWARQPMGNPGRADGTHEP